jgi:hypothetical protein
MANWNLVTEMFKLKLETWLAAQVALFLDAIPFVFFPWLY